ncbi:hypothetical protein IT418_03530 [bacterium]|nr:hypothetical protein [bacterium]
MGKDFENSPQKEGIDSLINPLITYISGIVVGREQEVCESPKFQRNLRELLLTGATIFESNQFVEQSLVKQMVRNSREFLREPGDRRGLEKELRRMITPEVAREYQKNGISRLVTPLGVISFEQDALHLNPVNYRETIASSDNAVKLELLPTTDAAKSHGAGKELTTAAIESRRPEMPDKGGNRQQATSRTVFSAAFSAVFGFVSLTTQVPALSNSGMVCPSDLRNLPANVLIIPELPLGVTACKIYNPIIDENGAIIGYEPNNGTLEIHIDEGKAVDILELCSLTQQSNPELVDMCVAAIRRGSQDGLVSNKYAAGATTISLEFTDGEITIGKSGFLQLFGEKVVISPDFLLAGIRYIGTLDEQQIKAIIQNPLHTPTPFSQNTQTLSPEDEAEYSGNTPEEIKRSNDMAMGVLTLIISALILIPWYNERRGKKK